MYKSYFLYKANSLISELTKTDIKSGNTLCGRRKLIRLRVSTIQLPTTAWRRLPPRRGGDDPPGIRLHTLRSL